LRSAVWTGGTRDTRPTSDTRLSRAMRTSWGAIAAQPTLRVVRGRYPGMDRYPPKAHHRYQAKYQAKFVSGAHALSGFLRPYSDLSAHAAVGFESNNRSARPAAVIYIRWAMPFGRAHRLQSKEVHHGFACAHNNRFCWGDGRSRLPHRNCRKRRIQEVTATTVGPWPCDPERPRVLGGSQLTVTEQLQRFIYTITADTQGDLVPTYTGGLSRASDAGPRTSSPPTLLATSKKEAQRSVAYPCAECARVLQRSRD
jgi:hypothetical protein